MRIDTNNLKRLCWKRGLRLNELLEKAGVSRTAYYSLTRKECLFPKSVCRIANRLDVNPLRFLDDASAPVKRIRELQARASTICRQHPECDRDVVFRTLMNLDLPPIQRLRKALLRGRQTHLHR